MERCTGELRSRYLQSNKRNKQQCLDQTQLRQWIQNHKYSSIHTYFQRATLCNIHKHTCMLHKESTFKVSQESEVFCLHLLPVSLYMYKNISPCLYANKQYILKNTIVISILFFFKVRGRGASLNLIFLKINENIKQSQDFIPSIHLTINKFC